MAFIGNEPFVFEIRLTKMYNQDLDLLAKILVIGFQKFQGLSVIVLVKISISLHLYKFVFEWKEYIAYLATCTKFYSL